LYKPYQIDIDSIITKQASKWMCSKQCACSTSGSDPWTSKTESDLNEFDRTKENAADKVPLHFVAPDPQPNEVIFNSFSDCFYLWKQDWNGVALDTPTDWDASAQADFEAIDSAFTSIELVEYMWLAEACNGVCTMGLFSFSGVQADGIPDKSCQEVAAAMFSHNGDMILGWLAAGTAITCVAWVVQLTLCCEYKR
jgi:hypothetical protein